MKRVILFASLLVLASCKKEEVKEPTNNLDCKCGIVTNLEWVYGPPTTYMKRTVRNQCSNNNLPVTVTWSNNTSEIKVGDYVCADAPW